MYKLTERVYSLGAHGGVKERARIIVNNGYVIRIKNKEKNVRFCKLYKLSERVHGFGTLSRFPISFFETKGK